MFQREKLRSPQDLFLRRSARTGKGSYLVRIFQDGPGVQDLIYRYYEAVAQKGALIDGGLANPDTRQLSYYQEVLGDRFEASDSFIAQALQKWLPRMTASDRKAFADAMMNEFKRLRQAGKPEAALRNVYVKMMCWMYYRFERVLPYLSDDEVARVLYFGSDVTPHELTFLSMLAGLGVDILIVEKDGDSAYLKTDPESALSEVLAMGRQPFAPDFSLKKLRAAHQAPPKPAAPVKSAPVPVPSAVPSRPAPSSGGGSVQALLEKRFPKPSRTGCPNAWMKEASINQILEAPALRGSDPALFYHAYIVCYGAADRLTYLNELYQLHQKLLRAQRNVVVVDGEIPKASVEEIEKIRRHPYRSTEELIIDLAGNLPASSSAELQREMQWAFMHVMLDEAKSEPNLNRLTVTAVQLLCLILRYQGGLFQGKKEMPCYIQMTEGLSGYEQAYVRFLACLPVDILVLVPDMSCSANLRGTGILEIKGSESLPGAHFPLGDAGTAMRTAASLAESDLNTLLYTDSGMYRNQQFAKATAVTLQTTYDEIFILWDQELKYRPNFSTQGNNVTMPVIYAKISGVEQGKMIPYWQKVKTLCEAQDTLVYRHFPIHMNQGVNSYQALATRYLQQGRIRKAELKADRRYPFGMLREELQDHILTNVQFMLDNRLIKGTFENGTEYAILASVLNLEKEVLRLIQAFDFTKRNPKLVCVHTTDESPVLEDAVLTTFFHLIGFDVVLFVPTGYQTIERFLNEGYPVEHQIGEYRYDEVMPDLHTLPVTKRGFLDNIFKRG